MERRAKSGQLGSSQYIPTRVLSNSDRSGIVRTRGKEGANFFSNAARSIGSGAKVAPPRGVILCHVSFVQKESTDRKVAPTSLADPARC